MRSFFLFLLLFNLCYSIEAQENVFKTNSERDIRFFVRNICEEFDRIVICNGDSSSSIHPTLGVFGCNSPLTFSQIDSLLLFNNVKYFDIELYGYLPINSKLLCLGNDSLILNYNLNYLGSSGCDSPYVSALDTIFTDSIVGLNVVNNRLVYIRGTSLTNNIFQVYGNSFSLHINATPKLISNYTVIGVNQNNETEMFFMDFANQQIIKDTVLSPQMINPVVVLNSGNKIYIVSCPGDTIVNLMTYDYLLNSTIVETIYIGSGINVAAFSNQKFYFQPQLDTSVNHFNRQILAFDFATHVYTAYSINKRLKELSNPAGGGSYYPYLAAVEDTTVPNKIFLYDSFNFQFYDTLITDLNPKFIISDFRCPVKVAEYDDSQVEWKLFPNPSESEFKLIASGLICGRDYKVDIVDITGQIKFETNVHAKMTVVLPTGQYSPGVYFVRIHTLKGLIVQKVVKL